jgi:hypothetical protein
MSSIRELLLGILYACLVVAIRTKPKAKGVAAVFAVAALAGVAFCIGVLAFAGFWAFMSGSA